jgi:hypothetical protein
MAQVMDSGGGAKLVEYRLHLAPDVVLKLKRKALDRSEREGRTIFWSGLVRETLAQLVNEEGV